MGATYMQNTFVEPYNIQDKMENLQDVEMSEPDCSEFGSLINNKGTESLDTFSERDEELEDDKDYESFSGTDMGALSVSSGGTEDLEIRAIIESSNSPAQSSNSSSSKRKRPSINRPKRVRRKIDVSGLIRKKEKEKEEKKLFCAENNYIEEDDGSVDSSSTVEDEEVTASSKENVSPSTYVVEQEDSDNEPEGIEAIRRRNMERMEAIISFLRNPALERQMAEANRNVPSTSRTPANARRVRKRPDQSVSFRVNIPAERRTSARLQNRQPEYREEELDNIHENVRNVYLNRSNSSFENHGIDDLEEVVFRPQKGKAARRSRKKNTEPRIIIKAEDVTKEMINNIAHRVATKKYSETGTTCHQCRQKTADQKTCCRNPECIGIQGMFCGVCIRNRYGEDCATTLLNPNWICPVCRGKCNCSICRTKQGKRPTGILAPLAQQQGYDCVDTFLGILRGEGDRPADDKKWALTRDPEALLGFTDGGRKAHLVSQTVDLRDCKLCIRTDCDKPENLLGFSIDGQIALMGGHKPEFLIGLRK